MATKRFADNTDDTSPDDLDILPGTDISSNEDKKYTFATIGAKMLSMLGNATSIVSGFMSPPDKDKLDLYPIPSGVNKRLTTDGTGTAVWTSGGAIANCSSDAGDNYPDSAWTTVVFEDISFGAGSITNPAGPNWKWNCPADGDYAIDAQVYFASSVVRATSKLRLLKNGSIASDETAVGDFNLVVSGMSLLITDTIEIQVYQTSGVGKDLSTDGTLTFANFESEVDSELTLSQVQILDAAVLQDAKDYADALPTGATEAYADGVALTAEVNAKNYADTLVADGVETTTTTGGYTDIGGLRMGWFTKSYESTQGKFDLHLTDDGLVSSGSNNDIFASVHSVHLTTIIGPSDGLEDCGWQHESSLSTAVFIQLYMQIYPASGGTGSACDVFVIGTPA
jgi:hypothetical protein|tara:strand:- start:3765 stop:4952 length:1188 start_codon:yes stop_codon:yes gene_type:complete